MRAAGERVGGLVGPFAAAAACFCALFFGGGSSDAPLVWIGGIALLLAAALLWRPPRLGGPAALFIGSLAGLAVWCGISIVWSISPERSWLVTNRTVAYSAFALVGVLVGSRVARRRVAEAAAFLLALLVGWALISKCIPALYPRYGDIARLRSPLVYWNELALLCDVGIPLALWLAVKRRRVEGVVLAYGLVVTVLLTYSRFGVVLAVLAAAAWIVLDRDRVESLAVAALGGGAGAAVFGVALALPGITSDGRPRSVRVHDGWVFALVVIAGAAVVAFGARALRDRELAPEHRARVERIAAVVALALVVAGVVVSFVFAGSVWREFANPVSSQITSQTKHLTTVNSGNRWRWWQEAWHAFERHPAGGTGAGTFEFTNKLLRTAPIAVDEPHNMPLQFLTETGIVGLLLYLGAAGGALWGAWRSRGDPASLALGIGVAAFFAHGVADKDWSYVATCGPLFLLAGCVVARPQSDAGAARRPLLAVCAVAVALAAVYSLTAPWLAQRQLATASTAAQFERAHSYDPLNVDIILTWAAFENDAQAFTHYGDALKLEPENANVWYALGSFYFDHKLWRLAYDALNTSYTYDRFGPTSERCGLLDQARKKAFKYSPPKLRCPGSRRSASP